jgi:hypothetical protein
VTDLWLADPSVPSTIGVPTPDNVGESLELAFQLRLLSRSKNTWTPAGHLVAAIRGEPGADGDLDNPLLMGAEGIVLLRQVLSEDGPLMLELLREIVVLGRRTSRDAVAERFQAIVARAVARSAALGFRGQDLRAAREFSALIDETTSKSQSKRRGDAAGDRSRGPGVLEHRVAPRLEWLTDLGYLEKEGLRKNAFEYNVTAGVADLADRLEATIGAGLWADEVAVAEWRSRERWRRFRDEYAPCEPAQAYARGYRAVKRRIGPTPIREVAFLASLYLAEQSYDQVRTGMIEFAGTTAKASLTGGRYSREPENIYMSDKLLAELS